MASLSISTHFFQYNVFKVGSNAIPDSLLPHGASDAEQDKSWCATLPLAVSRDSLRNRLLAVSQATDISKVPMSPIFGFVVVLSVADDKSSFSVLSPSPEQPPSTQLVASICYVDPLES